MCIDPHPEPPRTASGVSPSYKLASMLQRTTLRTSRHPAHRAHPNTTLALLSDDRTTTMKAVATTATAGGG